MRDALTGLYNRRYLLDEVTKSIKNWRASDGGKHWLALMDLDSFKGINDTLGHDFGDAVLTSFAQHLKKLARDNDVVARLGGDEFCVVFCNRTEQDVVEGLQQLLDAIQTLPVRHDGAQHLMQTSIGVAELEPGQFGEALKLADHRLYAAKRTGRGQLVANG